MSNTIILEYVWVDGNNCSIFSKSRTHCAPNLNISINGRLTEVQQGILKSIQ